MSRAAAAASNGEVVFNEESKYGKLVGEVKVTDNWLNTLIANPLPRLYECKALFPAILFNEVIDPENGRRNDNFIDFNREYVAIDFDDGITIEDFIESHKQYKFWLYTTTSHNPDGKHKFRAIFKADFAIHDYSEETGEENIVDVFEDIAAYKASMMKVFPEADPVSFGQIARLFILPIKSNTYYSYYNEGEDILGEDIEDLIVQTRDKMHADAKRRLQEIEEERAWHREQMIEQYRKEHSGVKPTQEQLDALERPCPYDVCMRQPKIAEYMSTYSNRTTGNGDGDAKLWSALASLKGMNACDEAIEAVIQHAIQNNSWTIQQINRKLQALGVLH